MWCTLEFGDPRADFRMDCCCMADPFTCRLHMQNNVRALCSRLVQKPRVSECTFLEQIKEIGRHDAASEEQA